MNMDFMSALKLGNTDVVKLAAAPEKTVAQPDKKATGFRNELIAASRSRTDYSKEKGDENRVSQGVRTDRTGNRQASPKRVKAPEKDVKPDGEKETAETDKDAGRVLEELLALLQALDNASGAAAITGENRTKATDGLQEILSTLQAEGTKLPEEAAEGLSRLAAAVDKLAEMLKTDGGQAAAGENGEVKAFEEALGEALKEAAALEEEMPVKHEPLYAAASDENPLQELSAGSKAVRPEPMGKEEIDRAEGQAPAKESTAAEKSETADKGAAGDKTVEPKFQASGDKPDIKPEAKAGQADESIMEDGEAEAAKKALEAKMENGGNKGEEDSKGPASGRDRKAPDLNPVKTENGDHKAFHIEKAAINGEPVQADMPQTIEKLQSETVRTANVSKADIVNQIVKKAEFILKDGQQEMRMQLEPENLGKLTLRVAVERGLLTAKFVAESQQVKEIIESSFNQLKDMLAEKGIAVQSFSVSVEQDNKEQNLQNQFQLWKETVMASGRSRSYEGYRAYDREEGFTNNQAINPYSYHDGKVDFRA